MIDSKIYIGKNNPVILENINGVLHITENNISRPFIEPIKDVDGNHILTVQQNTIQKSSATVIGDTLHVKNIIAKNIKLGSPTNAKFNNGNLFCDSSNCIVSENCDIYSINSKSELLFLTSNQTFNLLPGGNIDIDSSIYTIRNSSVGLKCFNGKWRILAFNKELMGKNDKKPIKTFNEPSIGKIIKSEIVKTIEPILNNTQSKKITYVLAPALNRDLHDLYNREMNVISKLPNNINVKILIQNEMDDDIKNMLVEKNIDVSRKPKTNQRGLVRLNQIIEFGLAESDVMVYTNSDCVIEHSYFDKALCIKDVDLIMRNDDGKTLYKIGVDGFCITKSYYENVIKKYNLNFYIGEPYWDVVLFNIVFKINPTASLDVWHLTHPTHKQNWDVESLTDQGKFNKMMHSYNMEKYNLEYVLNWKFPTLSVVIVFYGNDESRLKSLYKCLSKLKMQKHVFQIIVVEANIKPIFNKWEVCDETLFKYKFVEMDDRCDGLWQKEALMNIGSSMSDCPNILFLDSDVYCDDVYWLHSIDSELNKNDVYVQPFKICDGSMLSNIRFYSRIYVDSGGNVEDVDRLHNPGLCVGIRKSSLILNGGINPFYLYGSGDSGMYYEMTKQDGGGFYACNKIFRDIKRGCGHKLNIAHLDFKLTHIDHGLFDLSYYTTSIKESINKNIKKLITVDGGLVRWVDGKDKQVFYIGVNKYKTSDIFLKCPHGKMCNKLILLMSAIYHFGSKHRICFPELNTHSNDFVNLSKYVMEPSENHSTIKYDMLNCSGLNDNLIDSNTMKLLKLSDNLQERFDNAHLDFNNSVGVAIRQGDFKTFKGGSWYVEPPKYISDDFFDYDNIYLFSDGDLNINIGVDVSKNITNRHPILDLMLLSKCSKIVRNANSSFGWLASMIGRYNKTLKDERLVGLKT